MFTPQVEMSTEDHCNASAIAGRMRMLCLVPVAITAVLLAACDSGPSDSDFVTACLKEGERGANKGMRREMGVKNGEDFCKCGATAARVSLSSDLRRAMILNMQGKMQEASAMTSKMSDADKMAAMESTMSIFGKCAGVQR
ncbi:MAG: hypothetical protein ABI580_00095 [Burkholderiaceae bacterium]